MSSVMVKLIDMEGKTIVEFPGEDDRSFVQMAENNGIDLPCSCCAGACFVCAAKIIS